MRKWALTLLPILLLAGCGSSPTTHFHTLIAVPPAQTMSRPSALDLPIQVGDVNLPGTLDRLSLVTRGSGTAVNLSDQDHWAAPLDELIRRALTSDLRDRLGTEHVLAPGDPRPHGAVLVVALNIQRFSGDAAGDVVLEADWMIGKSSAGERDPDPSRSAGCEGQLEHPRRDHRRNEPGARAACRHHRRASR